MTRPEELLALATRVEGGANSDMALAREVQCALGWHRVTPSQCGRKHGGYIAPEDWIGADSNGRPTLDGLHGTTICRDVPDVTWSLDAVEELRERFLPDAWSRIVSTSAGIVAELYSGSRLGGGLSSTEPRARLAALLRALAAKEGQ